MYLKIKVIPNSRDARVEKVSEDEYRIWVKEEASHNQANQAVFTVLQGMFPKTRIRLVNGHQSPSKIFSIN